MRDYEFITILITMHVVRPYNNFSSRPNLFNSILALLRDTVVHSSIWRTHCASNYSFQLGVYAAGLFTMLLHYSSICSLACNSNN